MGASICRPLAKPTRLGPKSLSWVPQSTTARPAWLRMFDSLWTPAMHGECKTPGGKLVAVDLDVTNGIIQNVRISGDFFVHPEAQARDVLHRLSTVITAQSEQLPVQQWNAKLNAVLPWDVELLGTSTQALAVALCRALGQPAELDTMLGGEHQPLNDEELASKLASWSNA